MNVRAVALAAAWMGVWVSLPLAGCEPRDQSPVGRGRRIFQRSCSGCHGSDGRGVARIGLLKPPRDLTQAVFQAKMSDAELRQSIRVGKGQMPAFGGLMADEDIGYVIAFIRSLAPKPPVAPPATPAMTAPAGAESP